MVQAHNFFSLTISEWGTIVTIGSVVMGFLWSLFKMLVKQVTADTNRVNEELTRSVENLTKSIDDFKSDSKIEHANFLVHFEKIDSVLNNHENQLIKQDEKIKTLFHREKK